MVASRLPSDGFRLFLAGGRCCRDGGGGRGPAEEEDVPQVQLPRRRPRLAPRHVHRRPRPALPRACAPEVTDSASDVHGDSPSRLIRCVTLCCAAAFLQVPEGS
jgi:hypothetical protein